VARRSSLAELVRDVTDAYGGFGGYHAASI